jgi:hypothetical protein
MRTEQPIDTGTAAGKCFLEMLGVFAEFETNRRKERQMVECTLKARPLLDFVVDNRHPLHQLHLGKMALPNG